MDPKLKAKLDAERMRKRLDATREAKMARREEEMGIGESLLTGVVNPWKEGYYGGKQATVGLDEEDEQSLRQIRDENQRAGGWGTAGEVASWLIPGGLLAKGGAKLAQLLPRALGNLRAPAGIAAAEGIGQGAYEGGRASLDEDPSRLGRMKSGAAWGAAGGAA
ncbi:unnamed protein product, partial [marine sediment metagenome]